MANPLITLEVINDSLTELVEKFGDAKWDDPNFVAIAQLKGLQGFVKDKVNEYTE